MSSKRSGSPVRILPEELANKIAAGEVVERPASVVKELVENALDAGATRVTVRLVAAGRRTVEVTDNGSGMSEQDAMLAIERHATSKIRKAEDLDNIHTLGFRGEALASIAAVSRFELTSRREQDESATRIRVEGGVLRDVQQVAAPVGTRVTVNRLYFNTPARAKFLKGITTELGQAIDVVQRHALIHEGVAWQLFHNDKPLLDIPENATLRERVALIWGLTFLEGFVTLDGEHGGMRISGLIGTPELTRSARTHQFFFLNHRPIVNRALQYGFEEGYRELLTIGRKPVGIIHVQVHPRLVDVNIHPAKREVRFRDERAVREAIRTLVRNRLAELSSTPRETAAAVPEQQQGIMGGGRAAPAQPKQDASAQFTAPTEEFRDSSAVDAPPDAPSGEATGPWKPFQDSLPTIENEVQTELGAGGGEEGFVEPSAVYSSIQAGQEAPMQVFDTYLLIPGEERLLIIDQHALHERLTYDTLRSDLEDAQYQAQQLAVPILIDVPASHVKVLESNLELFSKLGIEIEPFGGHTFQITAICHLYDESRIQDAVYGVLDRLSQGELFDREEFLTDFLRLAVQACKGSIKAGDRLSPEERKRLLEGFRRLRPPYTCPHGRPIITELTQLQMEKSFRRRQ